MAASIGDLNMQLGLSSERFVAGLEAAQKGAKTFVGTAITQFKRMFNVVGMIEDVFHGTLGSILELKSQFTQIDSIAKMADSLGLTTEELVGFQHAVNLSGVDLGVLERSFQNMNKALGGVATKGEKAGRTLSDFGVDLKKLQKLNPAEQYLSLVDTFNKIETIAEKTAFAMAAFGKAGQKSFKMFENGSKVLKELRAEADQLGLSFSRKDAFGVELARDAMTRLSMLFEGFKRQVAIGVAPVLAGIGEQILNWVKQVGGLRGVFRAAGDGIAWVVEQVVSAILTGVDFIVDNVRKAFKKITGEFKQIEKHSRNAQRVASGITSVLFGDVPGANQSFGGFEAIQEVNTDLEQASNLAERFGETMKSVRKRMENFQMPQAKGNGFALAAAFQKMNGELTKQIELFGLTNFQIQRNELVALKATDAQLTMIDRGKAMLDFLKEEAQLRKDAEAINKEFQAPQDKLLEQGERLQKMFRMGAIGLREYEMALAKVAKSMNKLRAAGTMNANIVQRGSVEAITQANDVARQVHDNPNAVLEKLLREGKAIEKQQLDNLKKLVKERGQPVIPKV